MIYVLITAAKNESTFIEQAIKSVISQTYLPRKWVIISDGSTDDTEEIISRYEISYPFIKLIKLANIGKRNFASQAFALNHAIEYLRGTNYDYLGCFDADISVDEDYFENLLYFFDKDNSLGIAGGCIYELGRGRFTNRPYNSLRSVPGAIQMFRKACLDRIGLFTAFPNGGHDVVAEIKARMNNYRVESIPNLIVYHHRHTGTGSMIIASIFKSGLMDYEIGYHPVFSILKSIRRSIRKPFILSALIRIIGFFWGYLSKKERMVPADVIKFMRKEQERRINPFLKPN
jgi:glycosyltransferase involved in cell wall biosynthesis